MDSYDDKPLCSSGLCSIPPVALSIPLIYCQVFSASPTPTAQAGSCDRCRAWHSPPRGKRVLLPIYAMDGLSDNHWLIRQAGLVTDCFTKITDLFFFQCCNEVTGRCYLVALCSRYPLLFKLFHA